jgi:hypothetical protein
MTIAAKSAANEDNQVDRWKITWIAIPTVMGARFQ